MTPFLIGFLVLGVWAIACIFHYYHTLRIINQVFDEIEEKERKLKELPKARRTNGKIL